MKNVSLSLGAALFLVSSVPAWSATVWYTDRPTWEAAVTVNTLVDFEGIAAPGTTYAIFNPWSITLSGITFADYGFDQMYVADSAFGGGRYQWNSGATLQAPGGGTHPGAGLNVTYAGQNAGGLDFMATGDLATEVDLFAFLLSNGDSQSLSSNTNPSRAFIGFVSTDSITNIQISNDGNTILLDNVALATAEQQATPEPATVLYAIPALGLILTVRRRAAKN